MTYSEKHIKWIQDNGITLGTEVCVMRKVEGGEDGWDGRWTTEKNTRVGQTGIVCGLDEEDVLVRFNGRGGLFFPYFVLEKVEETEADKLRAAWEKFKAEHDFKLGDIVRYECDSRNLYIVTGEPVGRSIPVGRIGAAGDFQLISVLLGSLTRV